MKKVSFSGLRVSHLSNNNANSLFQSTIQVITPVRTQLGDLGNAILDRFVSNTQKFGSQVNVQYRSKLTDPLHEINKADDNLLSEIKRTVVFMTKSRDLSQKAAAQDLEFFLEPYWDVNRRPVKTQAEDTAFERAVEIFLGELELTPPKRDGGSPIPPNIKLFEISNGLLKFHGASLNSPLPSGMAAFQFHL